MKPAKVDFFVFILFIYNNRQILLFLLSFELSSTQLYIYVMHEYTYLQMRNKASNEKIFQVRSELVGQLFTDFILLLDVGAST